MIASEPLTVLRQTVPPGYTDYNQHMADGYYLVVFSDATTVSTSGASMIAQMAMQMAPIRYLVRPSRPPALRLRRFAAVPERSLRVDSALTLALAHAWARREKYVCSTVQKRMTTARMSDSAAP